MKTYKYNKEGDAVIYFSGDGNTSETIPVNHPKFKQIESDSECVIENYSEPVKSWKDKRREEYPPLDECIDALLDGGQALIDLQAKRQAVKLKHPKD